VYDFKFESHAIYEQVLALQNADAGYWMLDTGHQASSIQHQASALFHARVFEY
jgi:hypothetical protein